MEETYSIKYERTMHQLQSKLINLREIYFNLISNNFFFIYLFL
jgi:hypothetical protein